MKTILSLFDGISGGQQALKNLNIIDSNAKVYASEIDKYAISTTNKHHPNTIQLGSVVNLNVDFLKNKVDLMVFGAPCQDLSIAKQDRQGLNGARSGLFYEAVRILNEIKPKYFLVENVASMSKEDQSTMTQCLFNIPAIKIDSALVSAQMRKRLYWFAELQSNGKYSPILIMQPVNRNIVAKDILEDGLFPKLKINCLTATYMRTSTNNLQDYFKGGRPVIFKPIRIGIIGSGGQGQRIYSVQGKTICLSANGGGQGGKTGLYKIDLPDGNYEVRKLTLNECCRLQGFPDYYVSHLSNTQGYKALGNSFNVPTIEHLLQSII